MRKKMCWRRQQDSHERKMLRCTSLISIYPAERSQTTFPKKSKNSQEILEDCIKSPYFACIHWTIYRYFGRNVKICPAGSHKVKIISHPVPCTFINHRITEKVHEIIGCANTLSMEKAFYISPLRHVCNNSFQCIFSSLK